MAMRLATYNIEWFNGLFNRRDQLLRDRHASGRRDVTRADQADALGIVFTAVDADAVVIVEAPDTSDRRSTVTALEDFAVQYGLRTDRAVIGFANDTRQEIALLFDPEVLHARHDPQGGTSGTTDWARGPRFDGTFRWDLDIDRKPDLVTFSKPPMELCITPRSAPPFRLIGVHLKSKAPHGAESPDAVMRLQIANRRKQLAQCIWLRQRIDAHLHAGEPLIVAGDLNDGPGLDEYEKLFGRSGVEVVLGTEGPADMQLYDPHAQAALTHAVGPQAATARFFLPDHNRYLNALLDYVMVSPDLRARQPRWRIWHPFDDPVCYRTPELREALLTASDHFPVSLDIAL
jgi:endonuclease/exonuclease/phosphatase family metal-dependent hydrolase